MSRTVKAELPGAVVAEPDSEGAAERGREAGQQTVKKKAPRSGREFFLMERGHFCPPMGGATLRARMPTRMSALRTEIMQLKLFNLPVKHLPSPETEMNAFLRLSKERRLAAGFELSHNLA